MRFLSLFSGIEAASVAWKSLGWQCVGVSEIERFPCDALQHHYPDVPNLGDVTKVALCALYEPEHLADIAVRYPRSRLAKHYAHLAKQMIDMPSTDLMVFGSPCQDLSVAGKRKGLKGARSGLFFAAAHIGRWLRRRKGCRFWLWENVPGAFTSHEGRDFAAVVEQLAGLAGLAVPPKGWGTEGCAVGEEAMVEWSTLDAQWFGVAQRRRRVFALADFGDWSGRPPVLLEPEGLRGDSAPSRGPQEDVAGTLAGGSRRSGGFSYDDIPQVAGTGPVRVSSTGEVAHCLNAGGMGRIDYETETMIVESVCATGDVTHTLKADGFDASEDGTGRGTPIVPTAMQVRRLTPRECERLQAFPDNYTLIPQGNGKPAADGPRYKALGNSMCVNVMRWIGQQIDFAMWFAPRVIETDEVDLFA